MPGVVPRVVPGVVTWKMISCFQKNLSVQKYARLCNAIINVKDCCKRNSGLLFPSSGGFSCDIPDKEYIYEVCCDQGSTNGFAHSGLFQLENGRWNRLEVTWYASVKILFRMRGWVMVIRRLIILIVKMTMMKLNFVQI